MFACACVLPLAVRHLGRSVDVCGETASLRSTWGLKKALPAAANPGPSQELPRRLSKLSCFQQTPVQLSCVSLVVDDREEEPLLQRLPHAVSKSTVEVHVDLSSAQRETAETQECSWDFKHHFDPSFAATFFSGSPGKFTTHARRIAGQLTVSTPLSSPCALAHPIQPSILAVWVGISLPLLRQCLRFGIPDYLSYHHRRHVRDEIARVYTRRQRSTQILDPTYVLFAICPNSPYNLRQSEAQPQEIGIQSTTQASGGHGDDGVPPVHATLFSRTLCIRCCA